MTHKLVQKDPLSVAADLLVVSAFQGVAKLVGAAAEVDKVLEGALTQMIADDAFEGKCGQSIVFPTFGKLKSKKVALIGLGEKKSFSTDTARIIGGNLSKLAERQHATSLVTSLVGVGLAELETSALAQAFVEGMLLADYRFHTFHGAKRKEAKAPVRLQSVVICEQEARVAKKAEEGIELAKILAEATSFARDLVNTPPSHMTPAHMAEEAMKLVGKNVSVLMLDKAEMEKQGMNAALAVARGSIHDPVGIHLSYVPRGAKKKIVLVGKAVTFDSGGLSIKPADGMMTMKMDMGGAAAVLGVFKALQSMKLNVEVHGIFLAVENMPGHNAYRPGDVVTAKNGMTIEVLNTDAEGRVTLADALSYAVELQPDAIIDLATLTGACIVALGDDIAGLFSNNDKLSEKLLTSSHDSGEQLWRMPLFQPYNDHVKSKIADLKNIGQRGSAGSISAALFLEPFVAGKPWAHLDIAGPAYVERETRADLPYGGTGYGVRLLVEYLRGL